MAWSDLDEPTPWRPSLCELSVAETPAGLAGRFRPLPLVGWVLPIGLGLACHKARNRRGGHFLRNPRARAFFEYQKNINLRKRARFFEACTRYPKFCVPAIPSRCTRYPKSLYPLSQVAVPAIPSQLSTLLT